MEKFRKNIIVGITGSIAVYKTCEVIRKLIKANWNVKVVMTENAQKFVSPLTFEILSKNPVYLDMFEKKHTKKTILNFQNLQK